MNKMFYLSRRRFLRNVGLAGSAALLPFEFMAGGLKDEKSVRFGIITDSHYADRPSKGTRFYRDSLYKVRESVAQMNKINPDFLIHLGDLKDEAENPSEATTLRYLQDIENEFKKFNGQRYHVLGNHDMDSITKQQFCAIAANTGVDKSLSHYHFEFDFVRFVVLDANYKEDGTPYSKGNFHWKDTWIPQQQLDWLRKVLSSSKKPCLIFVHQMLDNTNGMDHCVKNCTAVRKIIEESNSVLAVFQGHKHEEVYNQINKVHYYTFNGMVDYEGLDNNSFSLATIKKNLSIEIQGYHRSSDQLFK